MLAYGVSVILLMNTHEGESTCLKAMYKFCKVVVVVFGEQYLRGPNVEHTVALQGVFLGCLRALIVCAENRRIVRSLDRDKIKALLKIAWLFLKWWHLNIFCMWHSFFGMSCLIMISMCYNVLQFSQCLWNVIHRGATLRSTGISTQRGTTLQMIFVLHGPHL
jgi:presenilin-like A22 family membrane protease